MIKLSVAEIASAINATVHGDATVVVFGSVETDSRLVSAGALFCR